MSRIQDQFCSICRTRFHGNCRPYICYTCRAPVHRRCAGRVTSDTDYQCPSCHKAATRFQSILPPDRARIPTETPEVHIEMQSHQKQSARSVASRSTAPAEDHEASNSDTEPESSESSTEKSNASDSDDSSTSQPERARVRDHVEIPISGTQAHTSVLKSLVRGIRGNFMISAIVLVIILVSFFGLVCFLYLHGSKSHEWTTPSPRQGVYTPSQTVTEIHRTHPPTEDPPEPSTIKIPTTSFARPTPTRQTPASPVRMLSVSQAKCEERESVTICTEENRQFCIIGSLGDIKPAVSIIRASEGELPANLPSACIKDQVFKIST